MKRFYVESVTETSSFAMKCFHKGIFFSFLNLLANKFREIGHIQFCVQMISIRMADYL